jgi:hypothetical protein
MFTLTCEVAVAEGDERMEEVWWIAVGVVRARDAGAVPVRHQAEAKSGSRAGRPGGPCRGSGASIRRLCALRAWPVARPLPSAVVDLCVVAASHRGMPRAPIPPGCHA